MESTYTLKTAEDVSERNRLDEMHSAFKEYLDGKISFAPIYGTLPTRILELGCGSGAWAIDAAIAFPDTEVIATDLSPTLLGIPLPENVKFQIVDVTQNLPLELATFDIVRARLLLMHVQNAKDVLERVAILVKPGGWLVLEEMNLCSMIESGGPVVSRVMSLYAGILEARGADANIGKDLESIIRGTGSFSEIHAQKISMPISCNGTVSPKLARLGAAFEKTNKQLVTHWAQIFFELGFNEDVAEQYQKEIDSDVREVINDMHFVWAQRTC
ncbi:S-adenosyl-L-methionine-dependent methyltransferase [Mycena polygramma]|nr:S-adenosyl-L-methionine-dependent methyltransferase [Mycena polygramma]